MQKIEIFEVNRLFNLWSYHCEEVSCNVELEYPLLDKEKMKSMALRKSQLWLCG